MFHENKIIPLKGHLIEEEMVTQLLSYETVLLNENKKNRAKPPGFSY